MEIDVTVKIGGEAGQGIQTVGQLLAMCQLVVHRERRRHFDWDQEFGANHRLVQTA